VVGFHPNLLVACSAPPGLPAGLIGKDWKGAWKERRMGKRIGLWEAK